jgi:cell wall-associated NlpC family hydrolase
LSRQIIVPSPVSFDDVSRNMETPYFWISKIQNPDKRILSKKEIIAFNERMRKKNTYIKNIFNLDLKSCNVFAENDSSKIIKNYCAYYNSSLKCVGKKHLEQILNSIDYNYSDPNRTFAITIKFSSLRILPTQELLYSSPTSTSLDRLQQTELDFTSPLFIVYSTIDRKWYYVISEIAEGWITADSIAFGSKEDIASYKDRKNFAVVVSRQADLYNDLSMTDYYDNVRMGSILPISKAVRDVIEVDVPFAKDGRKLVFKKVFVKRTDVSLGLLPYTQRNVITQAFKYLDIPYGWGDDSGYPDCSSFIRQIFSCFGLVFPRNSYAQSKVGEISITFDKQESNEQKIEKILKQAVAGITIMYFPGHIMLYIGYDEGNPYTIHSLYGYGGEKNVTYILNRVTVSGLSVGANSKKGSLLERLTLMKVIK